MTIFHKSMSPGPGAIKDERHQFKTNPQAQGPGPETFDSFWTVYIKGTYFSPDLDPSPGPASYHPRVPPRNAPSFSIARRLTTPFYDAGPAPPKPPRPRGRFRSCPPHCPRYTGSSSPSSDSPSSPPPLPLIRILRQRLRRSTMELLQSRDAALVPPPPRLLGVLSSPSFPAPFPSFSRIPFPLVGSSAFAA